MLLSVIIPAYNVESTLQRAVDSVLSQSMKEFEVIIVDDGSTDGTGPLCDAIESQDQRIRVIHQANGGLSAARNTGINQAQGDYLAFLDSDDEYVNDIFPYFIGPIKNTKWTCSYLILNGFLVTKSPLRMPSVSKYLRAKKRLGSSTNIMV